MFVETYPSWCNFILAKKFNYCAPSFGAYDYYTEFKMVKLPHFKTQQLEFHGFSQNYFQKKKKFVVWINKN